VSYLQETVNTAHRELETSSGTPAHGLLLVTGLAFVTHGALGTLAGQTLCSLSRHDCCVCFVLGRGGCFILMKVKTSSLVWKLKVVKIYQTPLVGTVENGRSEVVVLQSPRLAGLTEKLHCLFFSFVL